jgi:hypothetical protein
MKVPGSDGRGAEKSAFVPNEMQISAAKFESKRPAPNSRLAT